MADQEGSIEEGRAAADEPPLAGGRVRETRDAVSREVDSADRRASELERRLETVRDERPPATAQMYQELLTTLEELRVMEEELRTQNDALLLAQGEVERERARYQELFEFAPDAYLLTDPAGVILEANRAAAALLGVSQQRLQGKPLAVFVSQEARRGFRTQLERLADGRRVDEWTLMVTPRDGAPLEATVTAAAVLGPHEEPTAVRWLMRDVTERRRELERSARAEAANRTKSEFLATMSHELRTPINAIIGYSDLLTMGLSGALTDAQQLQIDRIRASSRHLLGLVNEVLDLAKVETGTLDVTRERADVRDDLEAVLSLVQPQTAERRIAVSNRCAAGVAYLGDERRVRQILLNLLSNAVKFTRPMGRIIVSCGRAETPDVGAALTGEGPWAFARVEDTGIGIDEVKLADVFEPFVQGEHGLTRTRGGTGLGLAVSRRLARLMGGDLTARSRRGEGSTFTLWLPAPQDERAGAREEESPASASSVRRVGELLMAENDEIVAALVRRLADDPGVPRGKELSAVQLADHYTTYLADVAQTLVILDSRSGASEILRDGTDIQRLISERHGAQRHRQGWTDDALRREFALLREEVQAGVRRCTEGYPEVRTDEAISILNRIIDAGERFARRSLRMMSSETR